MTDTERKIEEFSKQRQDLVWQTYDKNDEIKKGTTILAIFDGRPYVVFRNSVGAWEVTGSDEKIIFREDPIFFAFIEFPRYKLTVENCAYAKTVQRQGDLRIELEGDQVRFECTLDDGQKKIEKIPLVKLRTFVWDGWCALGEAVDYFEEEKMLVSYDTEYSNIMYIDFKDEKASYNFRITRNELVNLCCEHKF
jgi:hypothetical protein